MTRLRPTCTVCGKPAVSRCKYCGDTLCAEHISPERHWCVGLEAYKKDLAARERPERESWKPGRDRFAQTRFGSFSGNYSFLLMLLISVSFVLQLLIPSYTANLILNPVLVLERPWTLVTHIFLHGGFEHFFFNMLFFVFFGPVLERRIGSTKFLTIFFLAGIFAGLGWCLTADTSALGASGALSGIFATLAVLMPRMKVYLFFFIPLEMWMAVIFFALIDFMLIGSGDMIAHTAHLSGLFFGLLAGYRLKGETARY
ncbi:MAG: rhomboid family intramembrane serine protease [Candidatus Methanospirareceae archaeon]